jgi:hypothetical protein
MEIQKEEIKQYRDLNIIYKGKKDKILTIIKDENDDIIYKNENYEIPLKTTLNDNIEIHYSLFLGDETKINTPYEKKLFYFEELGYSNDLGDEEDVENNGTIIKGLDQLIMDLTLGDFVKVKIPYKYAYGENGILGLIPKKCDLIYFLQIISIIRNDVKYKYLDIINFEDIKKIDYK